MGKELVPMKTLRFFTYDQNNSGGSFQVDDKVAHTVIIEAASAEEADEKAQSIGIYFDGVEFDDDGGSIGSDCPCCGDRWYRAYGEGDELPSIYGREPEIHNEAFAKKGEPYCHIYYANGIVKTYRK